MPNEIMLSIIIPAKNEEKRISVTLDKYGAFFDAKKDTLKTEIIVVVNNTDDATSKTVSDYSEKYPFIKKLTTSYSSGKGGAVALGFSKAVGDYIGFVDADGAVAATDVYKLFEFIKDTPQIDGVIGKRTPETTQMSARRAFLKREYSFLVKLLFDLPYEDTQCGAKIFTKKVAKTIGSKLSNTGWTFDVNLLLVAKYLNYQIIEQPVPWNEKEGSQFSFYEALFNVPAELLGLKFLQISHAFSVYASKLLTRPKVKRIWESEDSKNILIFAWRDIKHPEMGGSEIYVHQIAKRLGKKHEVTLFTSQPGSLSRNDIIDGIEVVRRGNFATVYIWAIIYYFLYFRKNTDIIIDVENGIPFFTPLYSLKPKMLLIHHVHKNQWFKQFNFLIALVGYILEIYIMPIVYTTTTVVTVSPSTLKELKELGFNDVNIYIAYNSIPPRVGGKYARSIEPLLVYVGRIKAYKQLELAIDVIADLRQSMSNVKLQIGGAGDHLDNLKEYAKKLNVTDNVEFLGFVSESKKWELLQKAWVFVMPSMQEGWGITIIEAASCGTPAVGLDVKGVRDSIQDHVTGFLARDSKSYSPIVKRLLNDEELRELMSRSCVNWSTRFSWNTSAKIFDQIISSFSRAEGLLEDKVYPWELDISVDALNILPVKSSD
jgi:glycosyltransferase involved in cell wall biosynthesis